MGNREIERMGREYGMIEVNGPKNPNSMRDSHERNPRGKEVIKMPILDYSGDLFGFQVDDVEGDEGANAKILCSACYDKLIKDGKISIAYVALGTEDLIDERCSPGQNELYVCDQCGARSK